MMPPDNNPPEQNFSAPLNRIDFIVLSFGLVISYYFFETYAYGLMIFVVQYLVRHSEMLWEAVAGLLHFSQADPHERRELLTLAATNLAPASKRLPGVAKSLEKQPGAPSALVSHITSKPAVSVLRPIRGEHVLVVGPTGSGKTHTLKYLLANLENVVVLDPHAAPETWPRHCQVFGSGRDYPAIGEMLAKLHAEMHTRYAQMAQGVTRFADLTIATDEMKSIVRNVESASQIMMDIAQEGRKVRVFLMVATHSDLVKALGIQGEGDTRENFIRFYLPPMDPEKAAQERVGTLVDGNGSRKYRVPAGVPRGSKTFPERVPGTWERQNTPPERVPEGENDAERETIVFLLQRGYPPDRIAKVIGGRKETALAKISQIKETTQ